MTIQAKYSKLSDLIERHCNSIYVAFNQRNRAKLERFPLQLTPRTDGVDPRSVPARNRSYVVTDEDVQESVRILGYGDENDLANRIHWYLLYYPQFFDRGTLEST